MTEGDANVYCGDTAKTGISLNALNRTSVDAWLTPLGAIEGQ
jgi:hypothetical protein